MDSPLVLTIPETCAALRLGRSKVYQLIKSGDFDAVKFGKATRLSIASVQDLVARGAPIKNHQDAG